LGDIEDLDRAENNFIREYCSEIYDHLTAGDGVHLTGESGVGKTTVACIIAKYAMLHQATVLYLTGERYFEAYMKDRMFDEGEGETIVERARSVNLLILDNPSTAGESKFASAKIRSLLKDRADDLLATVFVTDVPWDDPDWVGDLSRDPSLFESCPFSLNFKAPYWSKSE
jgi:DNA replication protein DnaC